MDRTDASRAIYASYTALAWLCGEGGCETFLSEYRHKRWFLTSVKHRSALLDSNNIETLVSTHQAWGSPVFAAKRSNQSVTLEPATASDTLHQHIRDGFTIVLKEVDREHAKLRDLCCQLAVELGARVKANAYYTGAETTGVQPHCDYHDVFIIQLAGKKSWDIFEDPVDHPDVGSRSLLEDRLSLGGRRIEDTVTLEPGNVLYVPRGHFHQTKTLDEASLHITVGCDEYCYHHLLCELVESAARTNIEFRRTLPVGFLSLGLDDQQVRETLHELLRDLIADSDLTAPVRALQAHIGRKGLEATSRNSETQNPRLDIALEDRHVARTSALMGFVIRRDRSAGLRFGDETLWAPAKAALFMRHLCTMESAESRLIRSIPRGDLNARERDSLVNELVSMGFLSLHSDAT